MQRNERGISYMLKLRPENIQLLENNKGNKLVDTGLGNIILNLTWKWKQKYADVTIITKKSALLRKSSTEWKGNLWNGRIYLHESVKGLISVIYVEPIQLK